LSPHYRVRRVRTQTKRKKKKKKKKKNTKEKKVKKRGKLVLEDEGKRPLENELKTKEVQRGPRKVQEAHNRPWKHRNRQEKRNSKRKKLTVLEASKRALTPRPDYHPGATTMYTSTLGDGGGPGQTDAACRGVVFYHRLRDKTRQSGNRKGWQNGETGGRFGPNQKNGKQTATIGKGVTPTQRKKLTY